MSAPTPETLAELRRLLDEAKKAYALGGLLLAWWLLIDLGRCDQ